MSDHITTYTGEYFYPANPDPEGIHIKDIAHALSMICRGNGHVKTFFSVGQHCIRAAKEAAARGYSERVILACLLHDASEAYMSDVPRPFKKYLKEYLEMENWLLDMIYRKYLGSSLTEGEAKKVKEIDDDLLYFDLTDLLGQRCEEPEPVMHIDLDYREVSFAEVEKEYLDIFLLYIHRVQDFFKGKSCTHP